MQAVLIQHFSLRNSQSALSIHPNTALALHARKELVRTDRVTLTIDHGTHIHIAVHATVTSLH